MLNFIQILSLKNTFRKNTIPEITLSKICRIKIKADIFLSGSQTLIERALNLFGIKILCNNPPILVNKRSDIMFMMLSKKLYC